ncbi:hypothetical protein [Sphingomonas sp. VNH70]|uniref:hypothetical protein n=1 Tax=Sphingomonas silueang TaxID=3156617 RepID=UPI0032B317EF
MQIKMTTGLSGPDFSLSPGDSVPIDDVAGQRLIDAGFAELDAEAAAGDTPTHAPAEPVKA